MRASALNSPLTCLLIFAKKPPCRSRFSFAVLHEKPQKAFSSSAHLVIKMWKIDVELIKPLPEPSEGETYVIEKVERVDQTPLRGLQGWRVTLRNVKDEGLCATMLWRKEQVGPRSKLGAFLMVLGKDIDTWIGKVVRLASWKPRERKVVIVADKVKDMVTAAGAIAKTDLVMACKQWLIDILERGKIYSVAEIKELSPDYNEGIITSAIEMLVEEGKAFKIPTTPTRYFYEG